MIGALVGIVLTIAAALSATQPAVRVAETIGPTTVTTAALKPTGRCAEWEQPALDAGWSLEQWPTLDRVIWCESRCDPAAHNPSGAAGLLQIMPMHWHGRDPYDPATNLAIGFEVLERQGWRAWSCYR